MNLETYGRGQVEWALWRSHVRASATAPTEPAPVFRTRIKRLLEIDRDLNVGRVEVRPEAAYAFAPAPAASGETAYTPIDVFCLAVALDLWDAGFKQQDVVFLARYLRPELEALHPRLLRLPPLKTRSRLRAQDHPNLPTYEHRGQRYADARVFMLMGKLSFIETARLLGDRRDPVFRKPIYCEGVENLGRALSAMTLEGQRAATILEVAGTAHAIEQLLPRAPVIRRGRPKS